MPFLKGPEGRREAADCRKENGELPPGRVGDRGPGQPVGLSCLPKPVSAGSAQVGWRPLRPGCWLVSTARGLAAAGHRCCRPAEGQRPPAGPGRPPLPSPPPRRALGLRCGRSGRPSSPGPPGGRVPAPERRGRGGRGRPAEGSPARGPPPGPAGASRSAWRPLPELARVLTRFCRPGRGRLPRPRPASEESPRRPLRLRLRPATFAPRLWARHQRECRDL